MALPRGAMGLSAVCDCGISWSYSLTFFVLHYKSYRVNAVLFLITESFMLPKVRMTNHGKYDMLYLPIQSHAKWRISLSVNMFSVKIGVKYKR